MKKLANLALAVAALAVIVLVVWWTTRPSASPSSQAAYAFGDPILTEEEARATARIDLYGENAEEPTVRLVQRDGRWIVANYHELPADLGKLQRFIEALLDAEVDRFVSMSDAVRQRRNLGLARTVLEDANGAVLLDLTVGDSISPSGTFAELGDAEGIYRLRDSLRVDARLDAWAFKRPSDLDEEAIASVRLPLLEGSGSLLFTRDNPEEDYTTELAEGETIKKVDLERAINRLRNARFTGVTTDLDALAVSAAREAARRVVFTTFDGETVTLSIGRAPAEVTAAWEEAGDPLAEVEPEDAAEEKEPEPGPVYVWFAFSDPTEPFAGVHDRLALEFSPFVYEQLPQSRETLIEPAPEPEPEPESEETPAE